MPTASVARSRRVRPSVEEEGEEEEDEEDESGRMAGAAASGL